MRSQRSIFQLILLLVAIPTVSYLIQSYQDLQSNWKLYDKALESESFSRGMGEISALIREAQIERGTSAVFLKSEGRLSLDTLLEKRQNTDAKIPAVRDFISTYRDQESGRQVQERLASLSDLRGDVERGASVKQVVGAYTGLVRSLMNLQKSTAQYTSAEISAKIRSFLLLESARESSGLLRAGLSGILAADLPIEEEQFNRLLQLKSGIDNNLSSEALNLSEDSQSSIKANYQKPHWKKVDTVFKSVLTLANEGGFGEDAQAFFTTITKVVDDIGSLIKTELTFIQAEIAREKQAVLAHMQWVAAGLLFNTLLILIASWWALKKIRRQIKDLIYKIEDASQSLMRSVEEQGEVSTSLEDICGNQSSSISETAASLEEISTMGKNNVEQADESRKISESIQQLSAAGMRSVDELRESIEAILDSNQKIKSLVSIIGDITDKTDLIDEIAFQTKILSFNASVEAERAGEQGRGFAVVAQEVGTLAKTSGAASEEISRMLKSSVKEAEKITDENEARVENGREVSGRVVEFIQQVGQAAQTLNEKSHAVASASREQALGTDQINRAVNELNTSTSSMMKKSQENSDAADGLLSLANGLIDITTNMRAILGESRSKRSALARSHTSRAHSDSEEPTRDPSPNSDRFVA